MSFKTFNESFKMLYGDIKHNSKPLTESFQTELEDALNNRAYILLQNNVSNIKEFEMAFQEVIENLAPDKSWWEVTDLNIFYDLFENRDVEGCIQRIIDNLKPEYKDVPIKEDIDYANQLVNRAKKDNRNISYKDAKEIIDQSFNDKVDDIETLYRNLQFDNDNKQKVKENCSKKLTESAEDILQNLLHNYEKFVDHNNSFEDDIVDFIENELIYSADCLKYFKIDIREMFSYGMKYCKEHNLYTADFDDFVRGAIHQLVSEHTSDFQNIWSKEENKNV